MVTNKQSAGILLYRLATKAQGPAQPPSLEVFLVHPGGPFWKNKNAGSWTIPKGEFDDAEPALEAAIREFREETGTTLKGHFHALTPIRQKGGKRVFAWAIAGDIDPSQVVSNTFEIEWPRGSGKLQTFPEIDKGGWFSLPEAREHINSAQIAFLDELVASLPTISLAPSRE
ncbi:MAG TPA: NUDIX domain-containing protein [Puia sp.]|nr:NUDIX domain-containing protein [Puia sp.]